MLTVGHGNATQDELTCLLRGAGITLVVDVRRFPGSRRHPHVSTEALQQWLPEAGVHYRWEPRLGGRRRLDPAASDADAWWRVTAFRAYAAHTRSPEFQEALQALLVWTAADNGVTALMCSESLWWRCHRRLIADVLVLLHGQDVLHLAHDGRLTAHVPAAGARIVPDGLRYEGPR